MKSNKQLHEENEANLYSTLKDGKPKGLLQFLIAHTYQIILLVLTGLIIGGIKRMKDFKWKPFLVYIGIGAVFGWTWNLFMNHYDPNFSGWMYHPWTIVGIEIGVVLEDIIFYIVCGGFFYILQQFIPNIGKGSIDLKRYLLYFVIFLFFISSIIFGVAGISISYWFLLPAMIFYIYAHDRIYLGKMFIIWGFVIIFASMWDIFVITTIPSIQGYAWASSWVYISFDANGIAHHSKAFLDYSKNRWAWIGNSPLEITPWFSICGGFFCYTLGEAVNKFLNRKKG